MNNNLSNIAIKHYAHGFAHGLLLRTQKICNIDEWMLHVNWPTIAYQLIVN